MGTIEPMGRYPRARTGDCRHGRSSTAGPGVHVGPGGRHRLGKPQAADGLVFSAPDEPGWIPYAEVSHDGRVLVVTVEKGSVFENQLLVLDLRDPEGTWSVLVGDFEPSKPGGIERRSNLLPGHRLRRPTQAAGSTRPRQPGCRAWRTVLGSAYESRGRGRDYCRQRRRPHPDWYLGCAVLRHPPNQQGH